MDFAAIRIIGLSDLAHKKSCSRIGENNSRSARIFDGEFRLAILPSNPTCDG